MKRGKFQRGMALILIAGLVCTAMPVSAKAAVKSSYTLGVGKSVTGSLNTRITKVSVKNKKIASVVKVSRKKFRITGVKPGRTVVTLQYGSKKKKKVNVSVGTTSIRKKTFQTSLKVEQTTAVSVSAKAGTGEPLNWVSSDDAIVSVKNNTSTVSSAEVASNQLIAHNAGKATITVTSKYTGKKLKIAVSVLANTVITPAPVILPTVSVRPQSTPTVEPTTGAAIISTVPTTEASIQPTQTVRPTFLPEPTDEDPTIRETSAPQITAKPATAGAIRVSTNVYGATLTVTPVSGEAIAPVILSEDQNAFEFSALPKGSYTVSAEKAGYLGDTKQIDVNGELVEVSLVLQKQEILSVKAIHTTALDRIQVDFSRALESVDRNSFYIDGIVIYSATLSNDRTSVILVTSKMAPNRSYTLHTDALPYGAGMTMAAAEHVFVAKEVTCGLKMWVKNEVTELLASKDASIEVYTSVYDEDGYVIKDLAGLQLAYTTTAGSFAQPSLLTNSDYIVNTFTSQEAEDRVDAYMTATIISAANTALIDLSASRTIVLNPTGDTGEEGIYLNDVSIESGDRMILYFNKEVNVTDYTQNCENLNDIYGYDGDKLQILIQDAGGNHTLTHIAEGSLGNRFVYALAPVAGNEKAICAYLDLKGSCSPFTNHARVVVQVTDRTQRHELTSTKYTTANDSTSPTITKVESLSLRTLRITFSEAVQSSTNAFGCLSADSAYRWSIDDIPLTDSRYGYGASHMSTLSVGAFDKMTGFDHRNEVTLTLGKNVSGGQLYLTQGIHRIACSNIGDWSNVTSSKTNYCVSQQYDFSVSDNQESLSASVHVYSPEQYLVTFDRSVDVNLIKSKLKLQEFYGQTWIDTSKNSIIVTPLLANELDTEAQSYMVEVNTDWTQAFRTSSSQKNYYNTDFRLHLNAGEILNLENGLLNKDINLPLDDEKMKTLDTVSPTIEKVQQYGSLVYVTMSEPVQIPGITEETPSEIQSTTGISTPTVNFISPDNRQTIPGVIVGMVDAYDMTFSVVPSGQLTAGTWRLSIASISDDIGNTSETLFVDEFKVNTTIEAQTGFKVLWVVAVPNGKKDPLLNNVTNDSGNDKIYVKFSQRFKTYGNLTNAVDTTNYSLNNASWPNSVSSKAFVDRYNDSANTNNNYTDLIEITCAGGTLTDASNTLTISSTIENIYGDRLANSGLKVLEKRTIDASNYYFAYNFKTIPGSEVDTVRKLVQYINDLEYINVNCNRFTNLDQRSVANSASLTIAKAGTFNLTSDFQSGVESRNTFRELNISTQETGTIRIKNARFTTINVDAPNAEVILDNVEVTNINVLDVLDGTLILTGGTRCNEMEITDSNNGCRIEVTSGDYTSLSFVKVNTVGSVQLKLLESTAVTLATPAKVTFESKVGTLTMMTTAVGAQVIKGKNVTGDIYTNFVDNTSSNNLQTAITYVNESFSSFETGLNSTANQFTVSMQPTVSMYVAVKEADAIGFSFIGNQLTYNGDNQQNITVTVTSTCTLNNTIYTASKTYRLVCTKDDIAVQS